MVVRGDSRFVIYGAFVVNGERYTDIADKVVSCDILSMEGVEVLSLKDITIAEEDGSVCVNVEPNTIEAGRYYYNIQLKDAEDSIVAEVTNEIEII